MNPVIVFFHIDKTGGTTVCDYLARQYPQEQIKPVPVGKRLDFAENVPTTHSDLYAANRKFYPLAGERLIMGHYDTRILDYLPDDVITLTVLREPVARVVSLYWYVYEHEDLYGNLAKEAQSMGMDGWLRRYVDLWDNAMTKQMAGCRWSTGHMHADEMMYQMALIRLKKIRYVGITSRLMPFLCRFARDMGWDAPEPKRLNGTVTRAAIRPEVRRFIEAHTQYDARLYQEAGG